MQSDTFKIERPEEPAPGFAMPARSFTVTAAEYLPNAPDRAVSVTIWQDASARTGHTVVKGEFNLSLQERKDLIAFLSALPDADHPF